LKTVSIKPNQAKDHSKSNTLQLPQAQEHGIIKADIGIAILIIVGFVCAGTTQFHYILGLDFTPKIFVMPMVMAVIFSVVLVRLRINRRILKDEQSQREFAYAKAKLLNGQLNQLLEHRTELLLSAQDQVSLAQTRADLGAMAAGVIHDINNALMALGVSWELFQLEEDDLQASRSLSQDISTSLAQAKAVTSEFGRFLRPQHNEVTEIISAVKRLHRFLLRSMGPGQILTLSWGRLYSSESGLNWRPVEGDLTPPESLLVYCVLSEGQLTQVIMNLVINARDALQDGQGQITLHIEASVEEVTLQVRDTGVGMDEELMTKVFKPFFTTKPEGEGTGLGLHVMAQVIERVKGRIDLSSELDVGTTFTISLPQYAGA
jgi:signal transduction histidine kinase